MKRDLVAGLAGVCMVVLLAGAIWWFARAPRSDAPQDESAAVLRQEQETDAQEYEKTIQDLRVELDAVRAYRQKLAEILDELRKLAPVVIGALLLAVLSMAPARAMAQDYSVPKYKIGLDGTLCFGVVDTSQLLHTAQQAPALRLQLRTLEADRSAAQDEIRILEAMHTHAEAKLRAAYERAEDWARIERKLRTENAQLAAQLARTTRHRNIFLGVGLAVIGGAVIGIVAVQ